jgi:hypothetical protein
MSEMVYWKTPLFASSFRAMMCAREKSTGVFT